MNTLKDIRDQIIIAALRAGALACLTMAAACRLLSRIAAALADMWPMLRASLYRIADRIRAARQLLPLVAVALLPVVFPVVVAVSDAFKQIRENPVPMMDGWRDAWTFRRQILAECR